MTDTTTTGDGEASPSPAAEASAPATAAAPPEATATAPEASTPAAPATHRRTAWVASSAVGLLVTALLWAYSARQWGLYRVPSWDLGIFTQVVRAYSELRAPIVTIKGEDFMILGDHFHPLLVVLAPFYAVHPSGFTLLAAQAVLFGAGAGIVTWFAVRALGPWGAAIGLASGLSYLVVEAHASQFHEIALALPLLAMSLGMLTRRRGVAAVVWALPLLGIKEDLGLTVAAIGVVVALRASSRRERVWGWSTAGLGLAAFVAITQWVLPALNPDGVWDYADDSIVSLLLSDPGAAIERLMTGLDVKVAMIALPILVSGVVSVRSPLALIAVPTFAWRFASDVPFHWGTSFHYGAVLAPIMFLALVDGLGALPTAKRRSWFTPALAGACLVLAVGLTPRFALWRLTEPVTDWSLDRAATLRQAEDRIADDEAVEMDITLMAYLAPRAYPYWLGNDNPLPDAFVVDRSSGVLNPAPEDIAAYAASKHPGTSWVTEWDVWPVGIARPVP